MSKFQLFSFLAFLSLAISCTNDLSEEASSENSEEVDEVISEVDQMDTSTYALNLKGFIGDSPVTANFRVAIQETSISGYYFYDKYKKNIRLEGDQVEWYGGPVYKMTELDENDKITAEWQWFTERDAGFYVGEFKLINEEEKIGIYLLDTESELYLDADSKMLFSSENQADQFFNDHHFLNNSTNAKSGIIVLNRNEDYDYETWAVLPPGIDIYEHDGGDGFGVEKTGTVDEEGNLAFDDRDTEDWEEYGIDWLETGYELRTARFSEVVNSEYVVLEGTGYNSIFLKIVDLAEKGYHLEGDGYWVKARSGSVLGFYQIEDIDIYVDTDAKSEVVARIDNNTEGRFSLLNTKVVNNNCWAEVRYDYYEKVPCTDQTFPPKPSEFGWIELYSYDDKNYRKILNLDFYSRGC